VQHITSHHIASLSELQALFVTKRCYAVGRDHRQPSGRKRAATSCGRGKTPSRGGGTRQGQGGERVRPLIFLPLLPALCFPPHPLTIPPPPSPPTPRHLSHLIVHPFRNSLGDFALSNAKKKKRRLRLKPNAVRKPRPPARRRPRSGELAKRPSSSKPEQNASTRLTTPWDQSTKLYPPLNNPSRPQQNTIQYNTIQYKPLFRIHCLHSYHNFCTVKKRFPSLHSPTFFSKQREEQRLKREADEKRQQEEEDRRKAEQAAELHRKKEAQLKAEQVRHTKPQQSNPIQSNPINPFITQ